MVTAVNQINHSVVLLLTTWLNFALLWPWECTLLMEPSQALVPGHFLFRYSLMQVPNKLKWIKSWTFPFPQLIWSIVRALLERWDTPLSDRERRRDSRTNFNSDGWFGMFGEFFPLIQILFPFSPAHIMQLWMGGWGFVCHTLRLILKKGAERECKQTNSSPAPHLWPEGALFKLPSGLILTRDWNAAGFDRVQNCSWENEQGE